MSDKVKKEIYEWICAVLVVIIIILCLQNHRLKENNDHMRQWIKENQQYYEIPNDGKANHTDPTYYYY